MAYRFRWATLQPVFEQPETMVWNSRSHPRQIRISRAGLREAEGENAGLAFIDSLEPEAQSLCRARIDLYLVIIFFRWTDIELVPAWTTKMSGT